MALLQDDKCVFYGRFDGPTGPYDHRNNVALSGVMTWTDGKLQQGMTGRGMTTTVGAPATFVARTTQPVSIVKLDTNYVLACYADSNDTGHGKCKVGTVINDTITWGAETIFSSGGMATQIKVIALSPTSVAVCFQDSSQNQNGVARYGNFDGTKITWGHSAKFFTSFGNFSNMTAAPLSTSGFVVAYVDQADQQYGKVVLGQVVGGTVSFGSASMFTDSVGTNSIDMIAVNSTRIMVAYNDSSLNYAGKVRLADLVAGGFVWRSPDYFLPTGPAWNISLAQIGSFLGTKPRISVAYRDADTYGWSRCVSLNGTTFVWSPAPKRLTYNANKFVPGNQYGLWMLQGACLTADGPVFCFTADQGTSYGDFQWTNPTAIGTFENGVMTSADSQHLIVAYTDPADGSKGKARVVTAIGSHVYLTQNAAGTVSAVGQSGIVVSLWGRSFTQATQTLMLNRGYTINFTDHRIALSGTAAGQAVQWSGGTVETLLNTMNDGAWHFLCAHLKRGTGSNWTLTTSIDNRAYVAHGNQTSGTWTGSVSDTPFHIDYKSLPSGSIDEVAMWFVPAPFTAYQTSGMYSLASDNRPLNQYSEYCASAISGWKTATIYGPTQLTAPLPTFVKADDLPFESSGAVFYHPLNSTVEWTKTSGWRGEGEYITGQVDKALCPDFSQIFTVKASGFLAHNKNIAPSITYMKNDVALVLTSSGTGTTNIGILPVRRTGSDIQYGTFYMLNAASAGNGRQIIPIDETRVLAIVSSQNNNVARVYNVNPDDLTVTSGLAYSSLTWIHPYDGVGTAGFHGSLSWIEGVTMSTSGETAKILMVGDDTYKGVGSTFLIHVSGMTVTYISPWKDFCDDINDTGTHMICTLDSTHAIIHHGSKNRLRMVTLTPDGSGFVFGREHIDLVPGQSYYSDILKLNDTAGILMVGTTNNSTVKTGNAIMPILFGESGISYPTHPSGYSQQRMGVQRIGLTSYTNYNNDVRMIRLSDTRFAVPMHAQAGGVETIYFMENKPTGINILGSGTLGVLPFAQTDDYATHLTMAQVDSSGVFVAYRRISDLAGIGRICHLGGNGPTVDTGTPTAFSTLGAKLISVANWGSSGLILIWTDNNDSNRIKIGTATYQNSAITYNPSVFVASGFAAGENIYQNKVLAIDGNRFVAFYSETGVGYGGSKARVVTANADGSVTLGTPMVYCGAGPSNFSRPFKISPSGFGVFYVDTRLANRPKSVYGSFAVTGPDMLTFASGMLFDGIGDPAKYHQTGTPAEVHGTLVVDDKLYTTWVDTTYLNQDSNIPWIRTAQIDSSSGLTWLGEPQIGWWETTSYSQQAVANMGKRRFLLWCRTYEGYPGGGIINIFDYDVDRDEIVRLHPWSGAPTVPLNQYPNIRATRLSDTTAACIGQYTNPYPSQMRLIKYIPASGGPVDGPATNLIYPSGSMNFIHAGPNGKLVYASNQQAAGNPVRACFGFIDVNSSGYVSPPDSTPYSGVTGDEQFMLMVWMKNPTASGTTVNIGRGLKFQLVNNKIRFGTNTVEWDLPTVSGLLASLNDGQPHQLIMDVQHQGGGSWVLRTSVDGGDWVSHGVQTFGTEAVPVAEGPAVIEILPTKPEMTQYTWLDDVYLYAGPKSVDLTGVDRQRIYSVGAFSKRGLDQYATYGLSHAASGIAFLQGAFSFFHGAEAKLYQTYDDDGGKPREYLTGLGWDTSSSTTTWLVSGVAGQGGYREGWGNHTWREPTLTSVSNHGALSGSTSYDQIDWTAMTWWDCKDRGRHGTDEFVVGQGDGATNSIGFASAGTSGIQLVVYTNGVRKVIGTVIYVAIPPQRSFMIGRVEFLPDGTANGYLSVNGEPWQLLDNTVVSNPVKSKKRYAVRTSLASGPARSTLLDETVLWQGVPLFTSQELYGLYQLGVRGYDIGNNSDKIYGPFLIDASAFTHIGPIFRSAIASAMCKGPTYPPDFDGLIFYQSCEPTLSEYKYPDATWWTYCDSVSGLVGSGLGLPSGMRDGLRTDDPRYIGPSELPNVTACLWASGVEWPSGMFTVGWRGRDSTPVQAVGVECVETSGVKFVLASQGAMWKSGPIYPLRFNPTFFVMRAEYSGGQPQCYLSVDGSGWHHMGAAPLPWFGDNFDEVGCTALTSESVIPPTFPAGHPPPGPSLSLAAPVWVVGTDGQAMFQVGAEPSSPPDSIEFLLDSPLYGSVMATEDPNVVDIYVSDWGKRYRVRCVATWGSTTITEELFVDVWPTMDVAAQSPSPGQQMGVTTLSCTMFGMAPNAEVDGWTFGVDPNDGEGVERTSWSNEFSLDHVYVGLPGTYYATVYGFGLDREGNSYTTTSLGEFPVEIGG